MQNIASDSQVQLLAFTWQNCLEQTGEWTKGEKLALQTSAPGRVSSIALPAVILGEGKSLISETVQTGLLKHGRQPVSWKLQKQ